MTARAAPAPRVALFLGELGGGGAERVMVTLANGLAARGVRVDVVLARARGPLVEDLGTQVHLVDLRARGVLWALPGLVAYLRRTRPAALLATLDHANVIAVAARALARVRTRAYVRVAATLDVLDGPGSQLAVLRRLVRWAYPRADAVIAVSDGVRRDLTQRGVVAPERVHVLYNPVIADDFDALAAEPCAHPFLASGHPLVVAAGRLVPQKDFATLLRAFARVDRSRAARLIVLGEGPQRDELRRLSETLGIAAKVDLPGFVDNPLPFMKAADVFVLSSRFEGLPSVLIQALACGTPVVSTDCPSGPAEVLEDGRYGALVPVGDDETMAGAVLRTLDAPGASPQLRARGRRFAVADSLDAYLRLMLGPVRSPGEARSPR